MGKTRRRWLAALGAGLGLVLVVAAIVVYRWQMPRVRERLVTILSQELDSRVELADLQVTLGRTVRVNGSGLVLHHRRETPGVPPLVRITRFEIAAPVLAVLRSPLHVESVRVDRLEVFLPKRRGEEPEATSASRSEADEGPAQQALRDLSRGPSPVVVDSLTATDAVLAIQSRTADRPPREFLIHSLVLRDAAFDRPVSFEAHLTNPKPVGTIRASGRFGPWHSGDPTLTPLSGEYRFDNADLGTIKGIGGRLGSTGAFGGVVEEIEVEGKTDTPDFSLDIGGAPVPLQTVFAAIVDGRNGDTILRDVRAVLGQTPISARGGVVHTPGRKGRTVALDVTIENGRLDDVLRLALEGPTLPMTGGLGLTTTFALPPGEVPVAERLELEGRFTVTELRFTSNAVQDRIDELSRRGRGRPADARIDNVASAMAGRFRLKDGRLRLQDLRFAVRGGLVLLNGTYVLRGGALHFTGSLRLNARASETMTGWKRWVLKPVDPLLAKEGAGTVLPIKVTGTAEKPRFGVDVKKIF